MYYILYAPDVSGCCEVGENFELENFDVGRVGTSDEEVSQVGLEHAAARTFKNPRLFLSMNGQASKDG